MSLKKSFSFCFQWDVPDHALQVHVSTCSLSLRLQVQHTSVRHVETFTQTHNWSKSYLSSNFTHLLLQVRSPVRFLSCGYFESLSRRLPALVGMSSLSHSEHWVESHYVNTISRHGQRGAEDRNRGTENRGTENRGTENRGHGTEGRGERNLQKEDFSSASKS